MLTFQPSIPEPVSATSLLAIIADPKQAKAHLDEIKAHTENLKKQTEDHLKSMSDLEVIKKAHDEAKVVGEEAHAHAKRLMDDFHAQTVAKETELSNRETNLVQREAQLETRLKDNQIFESNKATDLTTRENNVAGREAAVTKQEAELRQLQELAQGTKAFYEAKIANLRDALRTDYVMHAETGHLGATVNALS